MYGRRGKSLPAWSSWPGDCRRSAIPGFASRASTGMACGGPVETKRRSRASAATLRSGLRRRWPTRGAHPRAREVARRSPHRSSAREDAHQPAHPHGRQARILIRLCDLIVAQRDPRARALLAPLATKFGDKLHGPAYIARDLRWLAPQVERTFAVLPTRSKRCHRASACDDGWTRIDAIASYVTRCTSNRPTTHHDRSMPIGSRNKPIRVVSSSQYQLEGRARIANVSCCPLTKATGWMAWLR